jgi:cytochrome b pre-mRNA-processing protein 3
MGLLHTLRNLLVRKIDPATAELYARCVEAARRPVFYAALGVPDTIDGRFDLLLLHICLLMLRLNDTAAKQQLFDMMFADMDRSLREMGVGDMSIGKKMKPMLAGFYGRAGAYKAALAEPDDESLTEAISRNLFGLASGMADHAPRLARYVRTAVASLESQGDAGLAQGNVSFPTASP